MILAGLLTGFAVVAAFVVGFIAGDTLGDDFWALIEARKSHGAIQDSDA